MAKKKKRKKKKSRKIKSSRKKSRRLKKSRKKSTKRKSKRKSRKGSRKARKINFPTANVLPGNHIIPRKGVYCIEAFVKNQKYLGISNFGERPTVDGSKLLLETHIFNFNQEIYGNDLTVEFLTFIRPEQKFANFDELAKQIKKDIETAKKSLLSPGII